jgi:hypothetical protein
MLKTVQDDLKQDEVLLEYVLDDPKLLLRNCSLCSESVVIASA